MQSAFAPPPSDPAAPVLLTAAGTALLLDLAGPELPRVRHWGGELGEMTPALAADLLLAGTPAVPPGTLDDPASLTLLPAQSEGWLGRPGLAGHRDGAWCHPRLRSTGPAVLRRHDDGEQSVVAEAADPQAGIAVRVELRLAGCGLLRVRHELRNTGTSVYTVDELVGLLPVPATATELLDLTGRWCRERVPQRGPLQIGLTTRENRRGRTGHDATALLVAGTPGFGFRSGEVWGVHVGWSGNHQHLVQRTMEGATVLGGGELLLPGELRLDPGQSYSTPWLYFVHSTDGLDGLSERLHRWLRARPEHPSRPRPVVLNTWEAVYFDHRLDRLTALADRAASIGVERFVLDDGWFRGRRDDTAGLGDWTVDQRVWPEGLHPLVRYVRALGMEFGLWVEPEMVNPDSELARAHPDWLLTPPGRPARPARHQQVLDLGRSEVAAHLLTRLDALVTEYRIDYLKWDHNRDLLEAGHGLHGGVHRQTAAVYRLLADLRARHPGLEIESCSSGGARADLGILAQTDRVWVSDTNDPVERQQIQRWAALLLPLELLGSHVGPPVAHTTGRATGLRMRCATALFGHAGLEWDLTACTPAELNRLTAWVALYKRLRGLLHGGTLVRADHPDPSAMITGVVAADRRHAVFGYAKLATSTPVVPAPLLLPGLAPELRYAVTVCAELAPETFAGPRPPAWLAAAGRTGSAPALTVTGAALARHGLAAPALPPADALVLELRAVEPAR